MHTSEWVRRLTTQNAGQDVENLGHSYITGGNVKLQNHSGKTVWQDLIKLNVGGVPGWLSQLSIWLLVWGQVTISQFISWSPASGLRADSAEPAWDSLSFSLSAPPLLVLSLPLSQNQKKKKTKTKTQRGCSVLRRGFFVRSTGCLCKWWITIFYSWN